MAYSYCAGPKLVCRTETGVVQGMGQAQQENTGPVPRSCPVPCSVPVECEYTMTLTLMIPNCLNVILFALSWYISTGVLVCQYESDIKSSIKCGLNS